MSNIFSLNYIDDILVLDDVLYAIIDNLNNTNIEQAKKTKLFIKHNDLRNIVNRWELGKKNRAIDVYPTLYKTPVFSSLIEQENECCYQLEQASFIIKGIFIHRNNVLAAEIPHHQVLSIQTFHQQASFITDRLFFCIELIDYWIAHKGQDRKSTLYFTKNILDYISPEKSFLIPAHDNKILQASRFFHTYLQSRYGVDYQVTRKEIEFAFNQFFSLQVHNFFTKEEKIAIILNNLRANKNEFTETLETLFQTEAPTENK